MDTALRENLVNHVIFLTRLYEYVKRDAEVNHTMSKSVPDNKKAWEYINALYIQINVIRDELVREYP